jgi:hypothetical protein
LKSSWAVTALRRRGARDTHLRNSLAIIGQVIFLATLGAAALQDIVCEIRIGKVQVAQDRRPVISGLSSTHVLYVSAMMFGMGSLHPRIIA